MLYLFYAVNLYGLKQLALLLKQLRNENIRLFYKDLTTVDVRDAGVSVIRVMSPELSQIHFAQVRIN